MFGLREKVSVGFVTLETIVYGDGSENSGEKLPKIVPQACGKLCDVWPTESVWAERKAKIIKALPKTKRWRKGVGHIERKAFGTEHRGQSSGQQFRKLFFDTSC